MKHLRCIGLLLLLLVTTAAMAETESTTVTSPALPLAVFENLHQTLPPVIEGAEVSHTFIVRNKGEAPLLIEKVRTG